MIQGKNILIGITGGIAAYKVPLLVRQFRKSGAAVKVVMTEAAKQFVSPLTLSTLSGNEVVAGMWSQQNGSIVKANTWHIDLGRWANVMLIAPATANTIAKLAHGYADNAITTIALALRCPLIVSPAMDVDMWKHCVTQTNIAHLREMGYIVLEPEKGELASGLTGMGRLPELDVIEQAVKDVLNRVHHDLVKKRILVTAGPTYEAIDPVRFIGNRSSGKMGFAIANAAMLRGADVTLVTGPVRQPTLRNIRRIDVESAQQMFNTVMKQSAGAHAIIMAAAVADFTPAKHSPQKIKKEKYDEGITPLELKKTKDVLAQLAEGRKKKVVVGFALETHDELRNAKAKLKSKKLDFIVLNNPLKDGAGFGADTNIVSIISKSGKVEKFKKMSKFDVANKVLDRVAQIFSK